MRLCVAAAAASIACVCVDGGGGGLAALGRRWMWPPLDSTLLSLSRFISAAHPLHTPAHTPPRRSSVASVSSLCGAITIARRVLECLTPMVIAAHTHTSGEEWEAVVAAAARRFPPLPTKPYHALLPSACLPFNHHLSRIHYRSLCLCLVRLVPSPSSSTSITFSHTQGRHLLGIHASGFRDFLLKPELLRAVVDCGFEHPSEVQHECIPQAILGMDVLCQAKSGMGKTAVFVLSSLHQLDMKEDSVGARSARARLPA